jgi:hypothetical protein
MIIELEVMRDGLPFRHLLFDLGDLPLPPIGSTIDLESVKLAVRDVVCRFPLDGADPAALVISEYVEEQDGHPPELKRKGLWARLMMSPRLAPFN